MKLATWNIGEDERNKNGKLTLNSYAYIIKTIKDKKLILFAYKKR